MQLAEALEEQFERMQAATFRTPFASTVTELVQQLGGVGRGGGTAAAAKEMGVAQRTVQRYVAYEAGSRDPEKSRNPDTMRASTREKLETAIAHAPEAQLIRQLRKDGLMVARVEGPIYINDDPQYNEDKRVITRKGIPGAKLSGMLDLAADGNWEQAAVAFEAAFFTEYGMRDRGRNWWMGWTDLEVDRLDLDAG